MNALEYRLTAEIGKLFGRNKQVQSTEVLTLAPDQVVINMTIREGQVHRSIVGTLEVFHSGEASERGVSLQKAREGGGFISMHSVQIDGVTLNSAKKVSFEIRELLEGEPYEPLPH